MAMEKKIVDHSGLLYYHQKLKAALAKKVDKEVGKSLMSDTEIERLSSVINYDDSTIQSTLQSLQEKIEALDGGDVGDVKSQLESITSDLETLKSNAITGVKVNGELLSPTEHVVDVKVPKKVSELTDSSSYYTSEEVDAKVSGAAHYKGKKTTYDELPQDSQETGDMYIVETASPEHSIQANSLVIWNGSDWDASSTTIDDSLFLKADDIITNGDIDSMWADE